VTHELASPQDTAQVRSEHPTLTGPGTRGQREVDLSSAFQRIALTINRVPSIRRALPSIAQAITTELDLRSVSFGIAPDGWVARWSSEDEDFVLGAPNLPGPGLARDGGAYRYPPSLFDIEEDLPGDCCACLPIRACGAEVGVMLTTAKRGDRIDPARIELLEVIAELVAAGFERETVPAEAASISRDRMSHLLDILEMLAALPAVDQTIQPLLVEIAALFDARAATLILTDSANLECYSSDQPVNASQESYFELLTAPFVRRAIGTLRAHEGTLIKSGDGATVRVGALAVPLAIGGEAVGALALELAECRTFAGAERELAVTIGRHLSFSIERERRMRSYSRHNHLLSLVERVTASIARATSSDDMFARTAREIRRSFGYDCSIAMVEDNRLVFLALELDDPHEMPDWVKEGIPLEIGIMGRVARTGQPVFLPDVTQDPAFLDTGRGSGSEIAVPIRVGDEVVGVINIESGPSKPLEQLDFEIMLIIANHIGIALNNRQLIASERKARQAIEAIQRVSTIVAETLDPDESLRRIADTLGEVMGYPIVNLAILEDDVLVIKANYGERVTEMPQSISIHQGIAGRVARTGRPVFVENYALGATLLYWVTVPIVGLVEHDAYILTFLHTIKDMAQGGIEPWPLWWMLVWSGTLGSNLTVAGAPALYVALSLGDTAPKGRKPLTAALLPLTPEGDRLKLALHLSGDAWVVVHGPAGEQRDVLLRDEGGPPVVEVTLPPPPPPPPAEGGGAQEQKGGDKQDDKQH